MDGDVCPEVALQRDWLASLSDQPPPIEQCRRVAEEVLARGYVSTLILGADAEAASQPDEQVED